MKKYIFHGGWTQVLPALPALRGGPSGCASMRRVNRYRCGKCPYIYDPRRGDPDGGIPPGTPFSRIPKSWRCPVCGAGKSDFIPLEEGQPSPPPTAESAIAPASAAVPAAESPLRSQPTPRYPVETWTVGSLKNAR